MIRYVLALAFLLAAVLLLRDARAGDRPAWGMTDDGDAVLPLRPDGQTRSWRSWDNESGLRWGTVEMQPSGDYRLWDNVNGLRWGRIEVE
jgi:hypothetical protein